MLHLIEYWWGTDAESTAVPNYQKLYQICNLRRAEVALVAMHHSPWCSSRRRPRSQILLSKLPTVRISLRALAPFQNFSRLAFTLPASLCRMVVYRMRACVPGWESDRLFARGNLIFWTAICVCLALFFPLIFFKLMMNLGFYSVQSRSSLEIFMD